MGSGGEGVYAHARVIFLSRLAPAGELSLIETPAGRLCVMRDGRLVEGCSWSIRELAAAVERFRQLTRELGAAAGEHPMDHRK